jgi:hypothetical protein
MWDQYEKGKMTESETVCWSIDQFKNNYKKLSAPLHEDLPPERINQILIQISKEAREEKSKPRSWEVVSTSSVQEEQH